MLPGWGSLAWFRFGFFIFIEFWILNFHFNCQAGASSLGAGTRERGQMIFHSQMWPLHNGWVYWDEPSATSDSQRTTSGDFSSSSHFLYLHWSDITPFGRTLVNYSPPDCDSNSLHAVLNDYTGGLIFFPPQSLPIWFSFHFNPCQFEFLSTLILVNNHLLFRPALSGQPSWWIGEEPANGQVLQQSSFAFICLFLPGQVPQHLFVFVVSLFVFVCLHLLFCLFVSGQVGQDILVAFVSTASGALVVGVVWDISIQSHP